MKLWMFEKSNAAVTATLLLAFLSSCSPESKNLPGYTQTENSSTIFGGIEADQNFQSENGVVGLFMINKNIFGQHGLSVCSGTLIDKRVVLTAAHCVTSNSNSQIVAIGVSFKPNFQNIMGNLSEMTQADFDNAGIIFADTQISHSNYMQNLKTENDYLNPDIIWDDIAILRLVKNAPESFKLAQLPNEKDVQQLKIKSQLVIAGFGMSRAIANKAVIDPKTGEKVIEPVSEEKSSSGVLRKTNNKVVTHITADNKEFSIESSLSGSCHGDSGGPAFLKKTDGTTIQVGIADRTRTRVPTDNIGNCNEFMTYTGVIGQLNWILANVKVILAEQTK